MRRWNRSLRKIMHKYFFLLWKTDSVAMDHYSVLVL